MVKNYAVIDGSGVVVNVIAWCGTTEYNPGEGLSLVQSDTAGKGDIYDPVTETFSRPAQPEQESE